MLLWGYWTQPRFWDSFSYEILPSALRNARLGLRIGENSAAPYFQHGFVVRKRVYTIKTVGGISHCANFFCPGSAKRGRHLLKGCLPSRCCDVIAIVFLLDSHVLSDENY